MERSSSFATSLAFSTQPRPSPRVADDDVPAESGSPFAALFAAPQPNDAQKNKTLATPGFVQDSSAAKIRAADGSGGEKTTATRNENAESTGEVDDSDRTSSAERNAEQAGVLGIAAFGRPDQSTDPDDKAVSVPEYDADRKGLNSGPPTVRFANGASQSGEGDVPVRARGDGGSTEATAKTEPDTSPTVMVGKGKGQLSPSTEQSAAVANASALVPSVATPQTSVARQNALAEGSVAAIKIVAGRMSRSVDGAYSDATRSATDVFRKCRRTKP